MHSTMLDIVNCKPERWNSMHSKLHKTLSIRISLFFSIDVLEQRDSWNDEQMDDDGDESDTALLGTPPLAEIIITPVTLNDGRDLKPPDDDRNHLKPN